MIEMIIIRYRVHCIGCAHHPLWLADTWLSSRKHPIYRSKIDYDYVAKPDAVPSRYCASGHAAIDDRNDGYYCVCDHIIQFTLLWLLLLLLVSPPPKPTIINELCIIRLQWSNIAEHVPCLLARVHERALPASNVVRINVSLVFHSANQHKFAWTHRSIFSGTKKKLQSFGKLALKVE